MEATRSKRHGSRKTSDLWTSIEELLPRDAPDPVRAVRAGLPYRTFERVRMAVGASDQLLARALSISERTLHRRRREGRLTSQESDRLLLLAQVVSLAARAFDDLAAAREWLVSPHTLLSDESPLEHMDTIAGMEEVETMLVHIEHSMPA